MAVRDGAGIGLDQRAAGRTAVLDGAAVVFDQRAAGSAAIADGAAVGAADQHTAAGNMAVNDFAAARGAQAAAGHRDPGDLGLGAGDAEQAAGRRYASDGPLACRVCKSAGKGIGIGPIANGNPVIIYRNVITHIGVGGGMAVVDVVGKPVQLFLIINQILIVVEIGHRAIGTAFAAEVIMIVDLAVLVTTIDNIAIGGALGEGMCTDGLSPTGRGLVLRQPVGHFAAFEGGHGSVFQVTV